MTPPLDLVFFGLSLSSSWGNGHATTYRALLKGLAREGHRVLFLECDKPWYATRRDLPDPQFCDFGLYRSFGDLARWSDRLVTADAVIVGSYVPDGIALIDELHRLAPRRFAFYDIDTPVTLDALTRRDCDYLAPRQLGLFDLYFSFAGGAALDRLESLGARKALPLYCSVDPDLYRPLDMAPRWDLGYLGTYSPDRQETLEALLFEPARRLPDRRFVVAGAQFPDDLDWPANVEHFEHVPPADHAAFYNRQRFTLNVTRQAMRALGHSPSVRLFEAGACGTAILSDRWTGLGEVLPEGEALLVADGPDDVVAALSLPDARRRQLARTAQEAVLSRHTGEARARDFARMLHTLPTRKEIPA
ncbi:CgeB family protein [Celeribacter indicus]|uniref:Spore protein YkvP/CgeB glycosyl transferase-like domain-containing protein n=1 Tax=Celeribacter indicus TaxID=1208324 RepID=A0A0B5E9P0_9RHOB|nr:glycosyltransferase [Celeribacter indicus]AJE49062.1 hypothetical protein P73_4347 [Celeribacter indicus]SDW44980.1 Spore maturation protein CgeB [Celeribacter indicus]